jgi:organic hydroperoxide reductase OsmC/OhrA
VGAGMEGHHFSVTLSRQHGYTFAAQCDGDWLPLTLDEPAPLGDDQGPNASRVLGVAVGHCLASSLLFCLGKARVPVSGLSARVEGTVARNDEGRLRITELRVTLAPTVSGSDRDRMQRCLDLFEDFCTVSASVRRGIPIHVDVTPSAGS